MDFDLREPMFHSWILIVLDFGLFSIQISNQVWTGVKSDSNIVDILEVSKNNNYTSPILVYIQVTQYIRSSSKTCHVHRA